MTSLPPQPEQRPLGDTGLSVSSLGLCAGRLGDPQLPDDAAARLMHEALDRGVTLVDTARSHGLAEERIGRHLRRRRKEFILATKVGYAVPGVESWTGAAVTAGIERALKALQTDVLDVVYLHACSLEVLTRGECTDALVRSVRAGKVRVAGYCGDGPAAQWALESGSFGCLQVTVNLYDQKALHSILPRAWTLHKGVVAKRALGSAPWRFSQIPPAPDAATYWQRHKAMRLNPMKIAWEELALRFAAFQPGLSSALVSTTQSDHLRADVQALSYGPLPKAMETVIKNTFNKHDRLWPPQV